MQTIFAILAAATAQPAPAPAAPVIWTELTVAGVQELVIAANGKVDRVSKSKEGCFDVEATVADLAIEIQALSCKGEGDAQTTTEYRIVTAVDAGSKQAAAKFAATYDIAYLADSSDGSDYMMWRMDFTYGGVTRAHLLDTLTVTVDCFNTAIDELDKQKPAKP